MWVKRGKYFQKSDMQDEGIPCIHYGQIYTYYNTYTDKTIKFVSKEVASKSTLIRPQSIIITLTSENIEDVCKPVAWIYNACNWLHMPTFRYNFKQCIVSRRYDFMYNSRLHWDRLE